jgi:hypothetical protein
VGIQGKLKTIFKPHCGVPNFRTCSDMLAKFQETNVDHRYGTHLSGWWFLQTRTNQEV